MRFADYQRPFFLALFGIGCGGLPGLIIGSILMLAWVAGDLYGSRIGLFCLLWLGGGLILINTDGGMLSDSQSIEGVILLAFYAAAYLISHMEHRYRNPQLAKLVGVDGLVIEAISPLHTGKVSIHHTLYPARLWRRVAVAELSPPASVVVVRIKGDTLIVAPI